MASVPGKLCLRQVTSTEAKKVAGLHMNQYYLCYLLCSFILSITDRH